MKIVCYACYTPPSPLLSHLHLPQVHPLNILYPLLQQLDQVLTKPTPVHKIKDSRSKTRHHQQNPALAPTNKSTTPLDKAKHKHVWPKT